MQYTPIFLILLLYNTTAFSQCKFQKQWEYRYEGTVSPLSIDADILDRPYVYVASNEYGLRIFDTQGILVASLDTHALGMQVMNLAQYDTLLYIALGGHFSNGPLGIAIVNVSNPLQPIIMDTWIHTPVANSNGAGIVKVEGNYAYVGAMGLGLIILDISNPTNISFVSELTLNINYPHPNPGNPRLYNARGLEVRNSIAYVAFDAGGLRVINCTDKQHPVETGRYANPITFQPFNRPRAYNNIILNDTVAYVAVDYCGLEVLNIADTAHITLLDHYNPHDCPNGSWFNAPLHANELFYHAECNKLFMASGRSEMLVLDVATPSAVDSCGAFGSLDDTTATWGIGMRRDSIFLSYLIIPIYIPIVHPFDAKWNGIKMITWSNPCTTSGIQEPNTKPSFAVYPNPSTNGFTVNLGKHYHCIDIEVYTPTGKQVYHHKYEGTNTFGLHIPGAAGMYFIRALADGQEKNACVFKHTP